MIVKTLKANVFCLLYGIGFIYRNKTVIQFVYQFEMLCQIGGMRKKHQAHLTNEWFLSFMLSYVRFNIAWFFEDHATVAIQAPKVNVDSTCTWIHHLKRFVLIVRNGTDSTFNLYLRNDLRLCAFFLALICCTILLITLAHKYFLFNIFMCILS